MYDEILMKLYEEVINIVETNYIFSERCSFQ